MKILMVTMQFGRTYTQGTERYVATLSGCLRRRGHEVRILAGDPLSIGPHLRLGEKVPAESDLLAYPTHGWMSVEGRPVRELLDVLRKEAPDVVHLNTPAHIGVGIMAASRQVKTPCIVTVHDHWWVCPKGTLLRPDGTICDGTPGWPICVRCMAGDHPRGWVRWLASLGTAASPLLLKMYALRGMLRGMSMRDALRWMHRRKYLIHELDLADFILFPSRAIADVVTQNLSHQRWQVMPNGLTQEWFDHPRPESPEVKLPETLTIGFSGALAAHKAPHVLLEAVRLLGWRQTRIRLAGAAADPTYESRLRQAAEGLNVEFVGRLPAEKMPAFLRSLDVLAMTSVWPENCPYAVLEAQAAGVSVIGSRTGGIVEMIADPRLMFEPGSPRGLAAALDFAREHPLVGRSARVATAEQMCDGVERIYEQTRRRDAGSSAQSGH